MATLVFLSACLALLGSSALAGDSATVITKRCSLTDSALINSCLDGAITSAIRNLQDGYAALGMPSLDPLTVAQVTLLDGEKTLDLLNYNVTGLKSVVCDSSSFTLTSDTTFELSFNAYLPQFDAEGTYKMERYFLDCPKPNEGSFTFNLTGYHVNFLMNGTVGTDTNGEHYATLTGVSSDLFEGYNPHVYFSNLSAGRNSLWNKEPEPLLSAYKTAIDAIHPTMVATYANLLFQNVQFDALFLDASLS